MMVSFKAKWENIFFRMPPEFSVASWLWRYWLSWPVKFPVVYLILAVQSGRGPIGATGLLASISIFVVIRLGEISIT